VPTVNAIAAADFDGDGDNDVVISASGIQTFFNPGDGNLPEVPVQVSPAPASTLIPADIDLDGDPDLYGRAGAAMAYLNPGDGFFGPPMVFLRYDSNANFLFVADADSDGRLDALTGHENSGGHYLYLNKKPLSLDLNGNGIPDECESTMPGVMEPQLRSRGVVPPGSGSKP
jgi:hypothetical protein